MKPVEAIADYGDLCGECPTWSPRDQVLYWSDISGRKLYRYAWPARTHEVHHEGVEVSGIANHASGGLVIVNSEGIWLWKADGKLHLVVDTVEGRKCALNDCIADPEGRLFTGSCFFDPNSDDYDLGFLLRVEKDGTAQIVDEGIHLANGLGFHLTALPSTLPTLPLVSSTRTTTGKMMARSGIVESSPGFPVTKAFLTASRLTPKALSGPLSGLAVALFATIRMARSSKELSYLPLKVPLLPSAVRT